MTLDHRRYRAAWNNEEHEPLGVLCAVQWAQLAARVIHGGIAGGRSVPSSSCCCFFFYKRHAVAATHKGLTTQPTQTTQ
jgi:hypothetical protein